MKKLSIEPQRAQCYLSPPLRRKTVSSTDYSIVWRRLTFASVEHCLWFGFWADGQYRAQVREGVRDELVIRFDQMNFFRLWLINALKLFQADALEVTLGSMLGHLIALKNSSLSMPERIRELCGKNVELEFSSKTFYGSPSSLYPTPWTVDNRDGWPCWSIFFRNLFI